MTQTIEDGETRPEDDFTFEPLHAYQREKYGNELMNEASLTPEDMPETYQKCLLDLYPNPEQQAYINAMFTISQAAVYGLYAMQSYAFNEQRIPEVEELYPADLNQALQGKGGQPGYTKIPLKMSPSKANDVITTTNLASFQIKQAEQKIVEEHKNTIKKVIRGKLPVTKAPLDSKLKLKIAQTLLPILSRFAGPKELDQSITEHLDERITPEYLALYTSEASEMFSEIAHYIAEPFSPTLLYGQVIDCSIAFDNLNIYIPPVATLEVYSRVIDKARPGWSTGKKIFSTKQI